jgi:hypothetical protein
MLANKQLLYFSGDHYWSGDFAGFGCDAKALGQSECLGNAASRAAEEVRILSEQFPDGSRGNRQPLGTPCDDG